MFSEDFMYLLPYIIGPLGMIGVFIGMSKIKDQNISHKIWLTCGALLICSAIVLNNVLISM